ncbi:MAG: hypothetical protein UZ08_BCD001000275 [Candidatus Parvibacillus calidus]|jgi:hypothetical protein|nr:MAG: hypothetical protein UZ08_BCD001000275 [Candidatus Parvibacillus calidus]
MSFFINFFLSFLDGPVSLNVQPGLTIFLFINIVQRSVFLCWSFMFSCSET